MAVPNTFATATSAIPLANLDANFAYYDGAFSISGTTTQFLGNVGVGTSSPSAKFDTTGTGTTEMRVRSQTSGDARVGFWAEGAAYNYIQTVRSSGALSYFADLQTFNNASGTERMRITSAGDVGIGTSSPAGKIEASSSTQNIIVSRSTGSYAAFQRAAPTGQQAYDFYTINNVEVARITGDPSYLGFSTGSAATERMRIDSSGRLGVGVTSINTGFIAQFNGDIGLGSPTRNQTTTARIGVRTSNDPADDSRASVLFGTTAGAASSDSYITFNTNQYGVSAGERMRIDSSGNVGIGTISPITTSARLSVKAVGDYDAGLAIGSNASAANWARLDFKNTNVAYTGIIYQDQGGLFNMRNDGAQGIAFSTNGGNERMRIDASGNVGIGTNAPGNKLEVNGTLYQYNAYAVLGVYNAGGANSPSAGGTAFSTNVTNGQAESDIWNGNDPAIYANTGILFTQRLTSTTRRDLMFLHNNGSVGFGTNSPAATAILDIQSTTKGVRFPNMTTTQKNAITPGAGTVVFDTTLAKLCVYSGSAWQTITSV